MPYSKVLVTGGAGFIGSRVLQVLTTKGFAVKSLDLPNASYAHTNTNGVTLVDGDITNIDSIKAAMEDCDAVLHLAANPNLWAKNSDIFKKVNFEGTCNVLQAAKELDIKKVVHVSTESIMLPQKPLAPKVTEQTVTKLEEMIGEYCKSKWLAEQFALKMAESGLPTVVVNPTVPIGAGDICMGPASRMVRDFYHGKIKGYLNGIINLIDVKDVAAGIVAALEVGESGTRYLLGNENWRIPQLFALLSQLTGVKAPIRKIPYQAALSFAYFEEFYCKLLNKTPMATVTGIKLSKRALPFDASNTIAKLNLQLTPIDVALKDMISWMQQHGKLA